MKATYNEILNRTQIIANIPTQFEGRKLSASAVTSLLLMRVALEKKSQEYEEICRKALEEIKKDEAYKDFDKKAHEQTEAVGVIERKKAHDEWTGENEAERPAAPTAEEVEKAEAVLATSGEFEELTGKLAEAYNKARVKQAAVETTVEYRNFTRTELEEIVGLIGTEGTIPFHTPVGEHQESRAALLAVIADTFFDA
ncbi:MAG: hypothetical protein NC212_10960 [Staphylococcus sp.]|nr:hypothetical protein [Staphylococcus sp.]